MSENDDSTSSRWTSVSWCEVQDARGLLSASRPSARPPAAPLVAPCIEYAPAGREPSRHGWTSSSELSARHPNSQHQHNMITNGRQQPSSVQFSSISSIVLRENVSERPAWKDESWALLETDCDGWTGSEGEAAVSSRQLELRWRSSAFRAQLFWFVQEKPLSWHWAHYKSIQRRPSQPISWLVQNTQPSQPIVWMIN